MASEIPHDLHMALKEMVASLSSLNLRFALIGGIAVGYRSRPRFTRDIVFLLEIPQVFCRACWRIWSSVAFPSTPSGPSGKGQDLDFIRREWITVAGENDPRYLTFKEVAAKLDLPGPPSGSSANTSADS